MDYMIVVSDRLRSFGTDSNGLENQVKDLIEEGWEPLGGVVASPNGWVQTMIKKE